jgi:hypothetical protein
MASAHFRIDDPISRSSIPFSNGSEIRVVVAVRVAAESRGLRPVAERDVGWAIRGAKAARHSGRRDDGSQSSLARTTSQSVSSSSSPVSEIAER